MPWEVSDVDKFKKGLNRKQKERWKSVANSILEECLQGGGEQEKCEAKAIKTANGVIENMNQNTIIIHSLNSDKVKEVTKDGIDYLVVPVVAVREQVLNGQFAPKEELNTYIDVWNDVPVPVMHPERMGKNVSSRHKEVIDSEVIGRFYNVNWEDNKLKGEIWVEINKAEKLAENNDDIKEALNKLKNHEPMDVSTAYFSDVEMVEGTHEGIKYNGVQRNIRPDHLALLPSQKGACSLEDGCGTMKVNHYKANNNEDEEGENPKANDESQNIIAQKLDELKEFIKNNFKTRGENMKDELITKISEYECNEFDEETLKGFNENQLKTIEEGLSINCSNSEEDEEDENPKTNDEGDEEETVEFKDLLKENYDITEEELEEMIENKKQAEKELEEEIADTKKEVIENEALDFEEEDLEGMSLNSLKKLAKINEEAADYSGRPGHKTNEEKEYKSPGLFFNKKDKGDDQ
ncbi:MAG: DUF2213 domain-containing protein [Bacillota bacterium]